MLLEWQDSVVNLGETPEDREFLTALAFWLQCNHYERIEEFMPRNDGEWAFEPEYIDNFEIYTVLLNIGMSEDRADILSEPIENVLLQESVCLNFLERDEYQLAMAKELGCKCL